MKPNFYPNKSNTFYAFLKPFIVLALFSISLAAEACYADFTYTNGCVGDTIFFQALDGYAAYSWDYGDTTSGAVNISHDVQGYHVYTTPGDYYVTLFVNIGAEWDYRTNLIHIGTTCFKSDFSVSCLGGGLYYSFADNSYGSFTSQFWDFGDPGAGTDDTTTTSNPYHYYPAAGNYVVTHIISNGTLSDTIVRSIYVDTVCLSASLPNFTAALNCVNDTLQLYASFSSGVTYVAWNFGDPASGAANTSTLQQPSHQFTTPGFYIITLVYGDGMRFDTLTKGIPVVDCSVWPGDANWDGEVNGDDVLALGIYYGDTGAVRNGATQSFTAQSCRSWNNNGFNFMYLQDLVDKKMADCNGDGVINSSDLQAIQANFGKRHTNHNNRSAMLYHSASDPTLSLSTSASQLNAGDNFDLKISLGTAGIPINNVYGCSFTIWFDPTKVDAGAIATFSLGWFDSTGNNLLTFYHEDYTNGRLDLAFVKTNLISADGYGDVATITFHTKPNSSGAEEFTLDGNAKIFNTNMYSGSGGNQEVFKSMFLLGTVLTITGVSDVKAVEKPAAISLYPNPSNGTISIQHKETSTPLQLEILNSLGQKVWATKLSANNGTETIQLPDLESGAYYANFKNDMNEVLQSEKLLLIK